MSVRDCKLNTAGGVRLRCWEKKETVNFRSPLYGSTRGPWFFLLNLPLVKMDITEQSAEKKIRASD